MIHRIKSVKPLENRIIETTFLDGIVKQYDVKKLYPVFPQFRDFEVIEGLFTQVKVDEGGYGISWNDSLDLDANEIWEDGLEVEKVPQTDINMILADNLAKARECAGMTQKQLSEKVEIYQADISKIERGLSNPSLNTLKRLADGMGMKVHISFTPKDNNN